MSSRTCASASCETLHGIRAHVGDQRNGAFVAQFNAFIKTLRQRHRVFRGITQAVVGSLLQL